MKVLLGVTGSVAAKLTPKLFRRLLEDGHEVQIIATKSSLYFWDMRSLSWANEYFKVWRDEDEWLGDRYVADSSVLHIELAKWADVFLIAPLSKNTLFKIAYGAADNLLTCTAAAWWPLAGENTKPLIIAPAMNTRMWLHPTTDEQIKRLINLYLGHLKIINPVESLLACGDSGLGALADIEDIVQVVKRLG
ncbi:MAG: flavoprotein [Candidatus Buchananbacteria bacterium]|nr:flavoprotein [Candidatus Buchananbacteria bacterium]